MQRVTPLMACVDPTPPGLAGWAPVPWVGEGQVRHTRLTPVRHAFVHGAYQLWLPLRTLAAQPQLLAQAGLTRPWLNWQARDHGAGGPTTTDAVDWLDQLLTQHGIDDAKGELWLQTFPRVLGHAFKPVSFWFALGTDGGLRAVVAEVNNTFGERHCYLLTQPAWGRTQWADKVFHVSPFCAVQGRYAFRFLCVPGVGLEPSPRSVMRIDHHNPDGSPLLQTSISLQLAPATPTRLTQVFWRYPLQSWGVTVRIHWHALRLWLRRVPLWHKPAPPVQTVTRSSP